MLLEGTQTIQNVIVKKPIKIKLRVFGVHKGYKVETSPAIMQVYLSDEELAKVQQITSKLNPTEPEIDFVIDLISRTTRIPINPGPPLNKVLISHNGLEFKIVSIESNAYLKN